MKRMISAFAFLVIATLGCRAQVQPNPTTYTCPAATNPVPGTAYAPMNQAAPASTVNYTDANPGAGEYCYIAQSVITSTGQVSVPSNVAGPYAVSSTEKVVLTGNAPTSGPTPTGYVFSRASAVASTLGSPALGTGTVAQLAPDKLRPAGDKTLALGAPGDLRAGE